MHSSLQAHELEYAAWFLDDAGANFEHHTANEIFRKAGWDTLVIATRIRKQFGGDAPRPGICRVSGERAWLVQFYTSQAMQYFAGRCGALRAAPGERPLNRTELAFMSELLTLAAEDHERLARQVCFDLTLDVTPENRMLFSTAVDAYLTRQRQASTESQDTVAATALAIRSVLDDTRTGAVDIPDFWLMYRLAERCRDLSVRGARDTATDGGAS